MTGETDHAPLFCPDRPSCLGGLTPRQVAMGVWRRLEEHEAMTWAAAVAFYAMLAIVPFLGIVLVGVALKLPEVARAGNDPGALQDLAATQLEVTLKGIFPREAFELVKDQIGRIQEDPPFGLISLGAVVSLWSASNLFLVVIDALNRTHGVRETRSFVRLRLTAMGMTLLQAGCLLSALIIVIAWPQILELLGLRNQSAAAWLASIVQWLVVFLMVLASFAMIFQLGPDAGDRWGWITPGTLAGTIAFLIFCYLFRIYVQMSGTYSALGAMGGVMVLLFWFWCVALVVLSAAELDRIIEEAIKGSTSRAGA